MLIQLLKALYNVVISYVLIYKQLRKLLVDNR